MWRGLLLPVLLAAPLASCVRDASLGTPVVVIPPVAEPTTAATPPVVSSVVLPPVVALDVVLVVTAGDGASPVRVKVVLGGKIVEQDVHVVRDGPPAEVPLFRTKFPEGYQEFTAVARFSSGRHQNEIYGKYGFHRERGSAHLRVKLGRIEMGYIAPHIEVTLDGREINALELKQTDWTAF